MSTRADHDTAMIPTAPDDPAVVDRLRARDPAAFESLVRTLSGRLLAVARRVSRTEADAEDAVQEAFLSAYRAIDTFDGRSSVSTWLHRIVVNAALARLRRERTHPTVSIDALVPAFKDGDHMEHPSRWKSVTDDGDRRIEQREALLRALGELPEEFREVIVLRDMEERTSAQVAQALNISDALVRQRLHRARQALVRLLTPAMNSEAP
jgi:RNA polymerase sigma-70 factor (ECF subfamily)